MNKVDLIVTRHPALVEYAIEIGIASRETPLLSHVTPSQIRGKRVLGVLPLHLGREAQRVIEIPLKVSPEDRGKELPLERVREIASAPIEYSVLGVSDVAPGDLDAAETSRLYGWTNRGA